MRYSDKFFSKLLTDDNLVSVLKRINVSEWKKLSVVEREDLITCMFNQICGLFDELNKYKLSFVYDNNKQFGGEYSAVFVVLNSWYLEGDSPYDCVYNCIHELGHIFQDIACYMYNTKNQIHPLFNKKEVQDFIVNNLSSVLSNTTNYISCSESSYEYRVQPLEYDADSFAYKFLLFLSSNFLEEKEDKDACKEASLDYLKICSIFEYNKDDIINFSDIYKWKYDDRVYKNFKIIREERNKVNKIKVLFDDLNGVSKEDILLAFLPCFWNGFDINKKKDVIKRYVELEKMEFDVFVRDGSIFIEDSCIDVDDGFKAIDVIFNEMAMEEIKRIVRKPVGFLSKNEELIVKNLKDDNIVLYEENPLIYNIQPVMSFRNNYIKGKFKNFFEQMKSLYPINDFYFDKYKNYISIYDIDSMNRKVKLMTGEEPYESYLKVLKARNNRFKVVKKY